MANKGKSQKEKAKHLEAYQYWFILTEKGHNTTNAIKATAEHMNVEDRTVWYWHHNFNWDDRAEKKRKEIVKQVEKKENRTLAENRISYLKILHKLLDDYIQDGLPAQIESVKDLEIVIKNCLVLQDAPSEVVKNNNDNLNVNVDAEDLFDEELMKKIVEEEKEEELIENNQSITQEEDKDI